MQSEEHWTGVNYHVAAAMIVEVMHVTAGPMANVGGKNKSFPRRG
jgi:hypothetical protein